jgi:hypothetical protein
MDTTETGRLCKTVEYAAAQIRISIGGSADISEILTCFWLLQDSLTRLIGVADHERGEVTQCRGLIHKVVYVLDSPKVQRLSSIPAVKLACESINTSLLSLERSTQQTRAES